MSARGTLRKTKRGVLMSIEKVRAYFESGGIADRIREFTV